MLPYYYSVSEYLKDTYGKKLYKLSLSGNMTCPNRDGKFAQCGPHRGDGSAAGAGRGAGVCAGRAPVTDRDRIVAASGCCTCRHAAVQPGHGRRACGSGKGRDQPSARFQRPCAGIRI